MEIDDYDDEEESMYNCLYCWEDCGDEESLDSHMREAHPAEADFESCPFCPVRAGNDIVDHLILNHSDSLSVEQVLKLKELEKKFSYGSSRTHRGDSVLESASSNGVVVDELLSFISEMPPTVAIHNEQQLSTSSVLGIDAEELSGHKKAERAVASSPVSEEKRAAEDKEARSRCDFAQGLMLSVLFDEDAAL